MRNSVIDIAKGIGILLIVFSHNWIIFYMGGELFNFIYSFQLLLFFFLAGILYKQTKDLQTLVVSKADSLLKPYFIVLLALGMVKILLGEKVAGKYFAGILYANGNTIEWTPLWFLPHLFMVFILIWILIRLDQITSKNHMFLWIIVGLFLLLGDVPMKYFWEKPLIDFGGPSLLFGQPAILPGLPFSLDIILLTSGYTLIGYLVSKQALNFKFNYFLLFLSLATFLTLQYYFNDIEDLNLRVYDHVLVCAIQAITAFYSILCLSRLFDQWVVTRQILGYIGSASLVILLFHSFIQDTVYNQLELLNPSHPIRHGGISLIAAIGTTLLLNYLIKNSAWLSSTLLSMKHKNDIKPSPLSAPDI
jgi:polysaccharide biosynthesis protein PslL